MPSERILDHVIAEMWVRVRGEGVFASLALAEGFKRPPRMSAAEREETVNALYGMLQHDRRLAFALEHAGKRTPLGIHGGLLRLWAYRVLEDGATPAQAAAACEGVDWAKVAEADRAIEAIVDRTARMALRRSLPDFIAARLIAEYGREAGALAAELSERPPLTLRVNTLKTQPEDILDELRQARIPAESTALADAGINAMAWFNVFATPYFQQGMVEVQDEASQLAAELVAPAPKTLVVDFCAGAGGKTLALGALMKNRGKLVALDPNRERLLELRKRARRAGLDNVQALELPADPAAPWPRELKGLIGKAARVLVDAPCTGTGALRRKPEPRWRLKEEDLERLAAKQEALARKAMELVLPNGRLIYATCSLLEEENERVVERLLSDGDFSLVPLKEFLGRERAERIADPSGHFLKLLPHRHGTDGFFGAVLRRKKT
ncbi:MAG: RsmB/NOP family class I SAM-dependent RNA methyltransferase [Planctomycetes bacterium]|nr:RsmB/NOP family class I SAM-dependent RNA methyltransferase [Planctomycetota bacterium]